MNIKLKTPKRGYKVDIKFEKPICDIGKATVNTMNIPLLNFILKDCSRVLLIEYTSDTSVENISSQIITKSNAWTTLPNLWATKSKGISNSYIYGWLARSNKLIAQDNKVKPKAPHATPYTIVFEFFVSLLKGTKTPEQQRIL